jgi:hypothetical protein
MRGNFFDRLKLALILLAFYGTTSPQAQTKDRLYFGLKFGGYNALYKGDNFSSKALHYKIRERNNLLHMGFFFEIPLAKNLALQPEVLAYEGGYWWFRDPDYPDPYTGEIRFNAVEKLGFVSIPVLLKYKVKGLGIYGGVQPDFLLSTNREINGLPVSASGDFERKDYRKALFLSGIVGLEYTFRFGLGASARYQLGLTNIAKPTELGLYENGNSIKTNGFLYGIHWRFGKPRKSS